MQRIQSIQPEQAKGRTRELLDTVQASFGMVPNAVKVMANSPAVLDGFLAFATAMGAARIGPKLHNQVKLTTSETNSCEYCTSILSATAPSAGLSAADIVAGRTGDSEDLRTREALAFARHVLESQGEVSNEQLSDLRKAGYGDVEIVEIVASVVLGCFTNFLNNVAGTVLDIPKAEPLDACTTTRCTAGACSSN